MKILLIEDSKFQRIANGRALVKAGHSVIFAGDGTGSSQRSQAPERGRSRVSSEPTIRIMSDEQSVYEGNRDCCYCPHPAPGSNSAASLQPPQGTKPAAIQ